MTKGKTPTKTPPPTYRALLDKMAAEPEKFNWADALDKLAHEMEATKARSVTPGCYLIRKEAYDQFVAFTRGLTAAARELDAEASTSASNG